jgi:Flp pilus assembly protein TadD
MSQAEEAYRLASQIVPGNPEAVSGLANVLEQTGRATEARRLLEDFARQYPDNAKEP